MTKNYHCIIFEQNDFFKNQVIEELLRERSSYYVNKNLSNDFWIVLNPSFLQNNNISEKIVKTNYFKKYDFNKIFYVVVISPNIEFINWMKLRLGYCEDLNNVIEKNFKSDGVYFLINNNKNEKLLSNNYLALTPEILTERFQSVG